MYCKKGTSGYDDKDTNTVVHPMKGVSSFLLFVLIFLIGSVAEESMVVSTLEWGKIVLPRRGLIDNYSHSVINFHPTKETSSSCS